MNGRPVDTTPRHTTSPPRTAQTNPCGGDADGPGGYNGRGPRAAPDGRG
jgi:hypothetical protein